MDIEDHLRSTLATFAEEAPPPPRVGSTPTRVMSRAAGVVAVAAIVTIGVAIAAAFLIKTQSDRGVDNLSASDVTCSHSPPVLPAVPDISVMSNTASAIQSVLRDVSNASATPAAAEEPMGLNAGILGVVGSVTTGFKVVVDDSIIDPATLATRLRAAVPAAAAGTVGVESSCVSSAAMGSAWRALSARNWNDEASQVTFTMSLNAATEKIDVGLDSNAPAGSAAAMKALAPNLINITAGTGTG